MALLTVNGLTVRFGGLVAVNGLTFKVEEGTIHGLIGPNGAGKSTVFNCLSRFYQPEAGDILFGGQDLLALKPHEVLRAGIARTFQNVELFRGMTVLDNVMVGQHSAFKSGFFAEFFASKAARAEEAQKRENALEILKLLGIAAFAGAYPGSLPYGKQKMVEFARALVSRPRLLLLDEPAAGLNPQETAHLGELIRTIAEKFNTTVLLVEHDMSLVMGICDIITVMDFGRKIAEGPPEEIRSNEAVIRAYLGEAEEIA